jgi:hypothetical protein
MVRALHVWVGCAEARHDVRAVRRTSGAVLQAAVLLPRQHAPLVQCILGTDMSW